MTVAELLQHQVAALHYRTMRALAGAPSEFGDYRASEGVRTPTEILEHMAQLVTYARSIFCDEEFVREEGATYEEARARFDHGTRELIRGLEGRTPTRETAQRMLQGPLADALTHTGQLAMLRRMAGFPMKPESYMKAQISAAELA